MRINKWLYILFVLLMIILQSRVSAATPAVPPQSPIGTDVVWENNPATYGGAAAKGADVKLPLAGKTVAIDPGHGGSNAGAVGPGGTKEKDVIASVSNPAEEKMLNDKAFQERGAKGLYEGIKAYFTG